MEQDVVYEQWDSTDRTELISYVCPLSEFFNDLVETIDKLTKHSYTAKAQGAYYKQRKEDLEPDTLLIQCDFAENFQFVIQDEVQSYHWSKKYCTLHPVVIYYLDPEGKLIHESFCIISDDLTHDNCFVHQLEKFIVAYVKQNLPHIKRFEYFTDGCAGQYKSYKNFINICLHEQDFEVPAKWNFFATSHGKGACDGIGGTVKRLAYKESLRRVKGKYILTAKQMYDWCRDNIEGIIFHFIEALEMKNTTRPFLNKRFESGCTVPGTLSYHQFYPSSSNTIEYKRLSSDVFTAGSYTWGQITDGITVNLTDLDIGSYVAAIYDLDWYVGLIEDINVEQKECNVNFMHPKQPTGALNWPRTPDKCLVPLNNIISIISVPSSSSMTSRAYKLKKEEHIDIVNKFANYLAKL